MALYERCFQCGERLTEATGSNSVDDVLICDLCNNTPMTATEQEVSDELADIFGS